MRIENSPLSKTLHFGSLKGSSSSSSLRDYIGPDIDDDDGGGKKKKKLSKGQIIGIVIGCIFGAIFIISMVICIMRRCSKNSIRDF